MTLRIGNKGVYPRTNTLVRGFTLLELFLAILIILVLLAISTPRLKQRFDQAQFKDFVKKTYLLLNYGKDAATLKNIIIDFKFDLENKKIFIGEHGMENKLLSSIDVPEKIEIKPDKDIILFYPDGTCQDFDVEISGVGDRESTISSIGIDGKIEIE